MSAPTSTTDPAAPAVDPAKPPVPAPPAAPAAPTAGEWDGKIESLPPGAQKLISDARAEAGKARTAAKETAAQEARDALLAQLGLTPEGTEKLDPDKLAANLAAKDAELLNLQRETAAARAARAVSADVDALIDSRTFETALKQLDPKSATFQADIDALVKTTVDANPTKFRAARAAGASGLEFSGGSGEEGQITEAQLKTMTPEQIVDAHKKGLTKNLL